MRFLFFKTPHQKTPLPITSAGIIHSWSQDHNPPPIFPTSNIPTPTTCATYISESHYMLSPHHASSGSIAHTPPAYFCYPQQRPCPLPVVPRYRHCRPSLWETRKVADRRTAWGSPPDCRLDRCKILRGRPLCAFTF